MSRSTANTTHPFAFIMMILGIAALLGLAGCGGTRLEQAARAADLTQQLGDILADGDSPSSDDPKQLVASSDFSG